MTSDNIIKLAREAGAYYAAIDEDTGQEFLVLPEQGFERFAALVAAAEREACAKLIETTDLGALGDNPKMQTWIGALLMGYADAIRAMGQA